jgi:uncharacterized membrane protein YdbT with pleckstrin-like domain
MISFREDEHILFEIRKHWFVIATEVSILILLAFIPLLAPQLLDLAGLKFNFGELSPLGVGAFDATSFWSVYIFLYCLWLLILWIIGFVFWTNYYLDVWIVTNEKIVDVEQLGMFKREVSILHLDRIQDITTEVTGIVQTFLKFGDLHVQTAGQQREFVIHDISSPDEVGKKLNEILMKYKVVPKHETEEGNIKLSEK